jgi:Winged helix DNA-binding domain
MKIRHERDIVDRRLSALGLARPRFAAPEEAIRWLGVVQSQDYGPAKWSVAQRLTDATEADLDRAFAEGRFLRTHVMRPTWHFVLPEDIRWLVELTGPRIQALSAFMYRTNGLTDDVRRRSNEVIAAALDGGRYRTRAELRTILQAAGFDTDGFRTGYLMMHAEVTGLMCSGPPRGKVHTYALIAERAPQARTLSRDEALGELSRRYFTSHGPSTVNDLRAWASLSAVDARRGLEIAGPDLERESFRDLTWWSGPAGPLAKEPSPTVHLLQGYDEYVMGYTATRSVLDIEGTASYSPTDRPIYIGVVILDGQVAGRWKRTISGGTVTLDVRLIAPFDPAQQAALRAAADRHGAFLGLPVTISTSAGPPGN